MATGLTLNKANQEGIAMIHSLPDGAVADLRTALENADLAAYADALAEQVAVKVDSIARADIDKIISTLSRLCQIPISADVSFDVFVDDVYDVMAESADHPLKLTQEGQSAFKARLKSLLEPRPIGVAAKARLVFVEHAHYLCYARIMTDVRPIFGEHVVDKPLAATIVHSLKIAYHDSDEVREFFVALDGAGLDRLSELIERAKAKADTLKATILSSGVRYLDMSLE